MERRPVERGTDATDNGLGIDRSARARSHWMGAAGELGGGWARTDIGANTWATPCRARGWRTRSDTPSVVPLLLFCAVVAADSLAKRDVFRLPDPFAVITVDGEQTNTTSAIKVRSRFCVWLGPLRASH